MCVATKLPWTWRAVAFVGTGRAKIVLLNNLGATGHSIEHLPIEEFCVLIRGRRSLEARARCCGGTDWGIILCGTARLSNRAVGRRASDFAPQTEQQIRLLRFMRAAIPQVSWELIFVWTRISYAS